MYANKSEQSTHLYMLFSAISIFYLLLFDISLNNIYFFTALAFSREGGRVVSGGRWGFVWSAGGIENWELRIGN